MTDIPPDHNNPAGSDSTSAAGDPARHGQLWVTLVGALALLALAGVTFYWSVTPLPAAVIVILAAIFVVTELRELPAKPSTRVSSQTGLDIVLGDGVASAGNSAISSTGNSQSDSVAEPAVADRHWSSHGVSSEMSAGAVPPISDTPIPAESTGGALQEHESERDAGDEPSVTTSPVFFDRPDYRPPTIAKPSADEVSRISGYGAYGASRPPTGSQAVVPAGASARVGEKAADRGSSSPPTSRKYNGVEVSTVSGYGAYGVPHGESARHNEDTADPDTTVFRARR